MPGNGFIVIDRKIQDWEWHDDSFTAWMFINLLLLANWKDGRWHGKKIPRGSLVTSKSKLSDITGQNYRTVTRTLSGLESTGEISVEKADKFVIIRINNYSKYQDYLCKNAEDHTISVQSEYIGPYNQSTDNRTIVTKKQSNKETIKERDKRDKAGRFVPPSLHEVTDYAHEIGYDSLNAQYFLDYYEAKGWMIGKNHMKSWKAAVRTWRTRDQRKEANHAEPERKPEESEYTPEALRRAGFSPIESADDFERVFGVTLTDEERNIGKK